MSNYVLKGHICHTPDLNGPEIRENAYVVCENGICRGVFDEIPERFRGIEVTDCTNQLIIPGMMDLHTHASQFAFRGTGMDCELLDWLNRYAFPEESRFSDPAYAEKAYGLFAQTMRQGATTRVVLFGTVHTDASLLLMDCMEKSGLVSYVGKVNMDRNAPPELQEESAFRSAEETRRFIRESAARGYRKTKPIITPRFVISCTDELLKELGKIRKEHGLPVQSHLSENQEEIKTTAALTPEADFYGDAYDRAGLFGRDGKTVMAHCVYSGAEETERIRENGVWIAHCPASNMNIASGIAPIRRYLEQGLRVGLGTDMAGGNSESMFQAVVDAIQVSKMYWRYIDRDAAPLKFHEAFYMATKGGGAFFGKTGSFEEGYAFDALVLDDTCLPCAREMPVAERLEKAFYTRMDQQGIRMKFVDGERIL
ncbi:MAG: amidohydrolase family protein [Clostridia bacterium]|nr:amidohydrolase family protein [Clostridia bacterium]